MGSLAIAAREHTCSFLCLAYVYACSIFVYGLCMFLCVCTWLHVTTYEYMKAEGKHKVSYSTLFFETGSVTDLQSELTLGIYLSTTSSFHMNAGALNMGPHVYIERP